MDAKKILDEIMQLDSKILELRDQFEELSEDDQSSALGALCEKLRKETGIIDPLPMSLVRATDMVCSLNDAATILGEGLSHPNQDIRQLCGEALITVGEESVDMIVPAIDMALKQNGTAAEEMPFILTFIDDPGVTGQIIRFLDSDNGDVVSSAIEALAEVGDPDAIPQLKKLVNDDRKVTVDDEEHKNADVTVGMLAKEAIEIIESIEE